MRIRAATSEDSEAVATIYNYYVANTVVTFEEEPITAVTMLTRMNDVGSAGLPWMVLEHAGKVQGYAYAGRWKARSGYRFSVETSIYLDPEAVGKGFGTILYQPLLQCLQELKIHAVMGGIALPNSASVGLHERLGYTKVAHFEEVGFKFGRWIDVGYWQRRL